MKKFLMIAAVALMSCVAVNAQKTQAERKAEIKERTAMIKYELKKREGLVKKAVKAGAKQMKKDGWAAAPGSMPLEMQLTDVYSRKYEMDGSFPKYIVGNVTATGKVMSVVRKQAMSMAQVEIADQIETEVAELIENSAINKNLNNDEIQTMQKMVAASKNKVVQKLGRTQVLLEAYRELKDGKIECQMTVLYDAKQATKALFDSLDAESDEAVQNLEKVFKETAE